MKLDEQELQKLRDISIKRILGKLDDGRRISVRCPIGSHKDRTPSFTIFEDNHYFCFSCNSTGRGAIDFLEALGYKFGEIVEELKKYI